MSSEHRLIGLMVEPGSQLLSGILGILKSGHAFVPIDSKFPIERIGMIARDCNLEVLITQTNHLDLIKQIVELTPSIRHVILLDQPTKNVSISIGKVKVHCLSDYHERHDDLLPLKQHSDPQSLVYVIYTSGSTGKPKGVPISNQNLIPLLLWSRDYLILGEQTRVLQNLSYCFDFGVYELLTTLLFGGTLYFSDRKEATGVSFYRDFIRRNGINTVHTTPSFVRDVLLLDGGLETLKTVHLGGEALHRSLVEKIFDAVGEDCRVYNGYGPTEASVNTTIYRVWDRDELDHLVGDSVPIGRPTANSRVYILDKQMTPVAAGVPGELYIGGPGLATGYFSHPVLTANHFLPNPFSEDHCERLYRTGDYVRFLSDGSIQFLGRLDEQIKLRGYRIELEEIESVLATHGDVIEAATVVSNTGTGKRLVAFVVSALEAKPGFQDTLRTYMREQLPEYMVPTAILAIEQLPLTPNGKTDRRQLSLLAKDAPCGLGASSKTLSPAEELVAGVWEEVLGHHNFGPADNFFELGGHSLLATQVINRLRHTFGSDLPLYLLFEKPTLADFARHVEKAAWHNNGIDGFNVEPVSRDSDLPLSFPQERIWFLNKLDPGNTAYLIIRAIRFQGALEHDVLETTFTELVRRHEILRTQFPLVDGRPVQRIGQPYKVIIPVVDLSQVENNQHEAQWIIQQEGQQQFDIEHGPMLKLTTLRMAADDHIVILKEHHLTHDGWTQGVLIREFLSLYQAFSQGKPSPLKEPELQFADFAYWQRNWLQSEHLENQLDYWRQQLKGADPALNLITDEPRQSSASDRGELIEFSIPADLSEQLRGFSRKQGVTLFMTMLTGFNALLHQYTGQVDISLGTGIANRRSEAFEDLLGMMVNTVVLRTDLTGSPSFIELLKRVRNVCLGAYSNQDVPLDKVVEALKPEYNRGHSPLFQGMFAFMDAPTKELSLPELEMSVIETHNRSSKYDFTIIVLPLAEQLSGQSIREVSAAIPVQFEYNADLFYASTIELMWKRYLHILQAVVSQPHINLSDLKLFDEHDGQRLRSYNNTQSKLPDGAIGAHQLFEKQAHRHPQALAVSDKNRQISYQRLNNDANRLAHYLITLGVVSEQRIALCLPRSAESMIAVLACFKSGSAYVALDPDYPQQRIDFMLADSRVKVVLTTRAEAGRFDHSNVRVISLDTDWSQIMHHSEQEPECQVYPAQLAYITYTSGSSGEPKAVGTTHVGLMNLITWHQTTYKLSADDKATMLAGPGFDASVWECWPYLAAGACICIPSQEERNSSQRLLGWLNAHKVTICFMPTPMATAVLNESWPKEFTLRALLTGGDKLLCRPKKEHATTLFNHYGPTENSVVTTACEVNSKGQPQIPSIGRPIANTKTYIVDPNMQLVPLGLPGELCISGIGLARGYLGRPSLTAEHFVPDPFSQEPGARLYRSGDLARFLENGEIEFLGRIDRQIKLRGFRIELSEIEWAMLSHPAIDDIAVVLREDAPNGPSIVAYYVAVKNTSPNSTQLRAHLKHQLPHYMLPSLFVLLDKMPLTANGKVDHRALPEPQWNGNATLSSDSLPRTSTEEAVAEIWTSTLGLNNVGIHENFFGLGGHSLIAVRVGMCINEKFQVEMPLADMFNAPTVAELSEHIDNLKQDTEAVHPVEPIPSLPRDLPLPLSFSQQRLLFLDQLEPGTVTYNIPIAVELSGRLNVEVLETCISSIIDRHEVLRTTFSSIGGQALQRVSPTVEWNLEISDLGGTGVSRSEVMHLLEEQVWQPFDLGAGPLLRGKLLCLDDDVHILLLTIHHIAFDGWSAEILIRELSSLYVAFCDNQPSPLMDLPIQYADFAQWQREQLNGDKLKEHLYYWQKQLQGPLPVLEFNSTAKLLPDPVSGAATEKLCFTPELCEAFKQFNQEQGVSTFMTLLAGLQILLHRHTGLNDVLIGTPIAGRRHHDLEPLIGFFANTLVLRGDLSGDPSFITLLEQARELTLEGQAHGDVPFEMVVQLQAERHHASQSTPLFQVMLVVNNQVSGVSLPDLCVKPLTLEARQAKFDLTLTIQEGDNDISGHWEYKPDRVDASVVRGMVSQLTQLLQHAISAPETPISRLEILSNEARQQLTTQWNSSVVDYPNVCIHEFMEEQTARTPNETALIDGEQRLTYNELNNKANRLARYLQSNGVGPDVVVGVVTKRSSTMVTALLAVLKAGGAYLPLDPDYPLERLNAMIEDACPKILLTEHSLNVLTSKLVASANCVNVEDIDVCEPNDALVQVQDNLNVHVDTYNLAYILYTSGSTGRPKGVAITHHSVSAFIHWAKNNFSVEQLSGVLASTSICFDLSIFEIFVPLASGGTVILAKNALALDKLPAADEVTLVNTVPSVMNELLKLGVIGERVCAVNLAGEPLQNSLVQYAYKLNGIKQVMNLYGPSEDTTYSTAVLIEKGATQTPTIGRPIDNTQAYILDSRGDLVPQGITGELYLGGQGLARGYYRLPMMTAERFVPDPISEVPGARLYRTGDLARFRSDGEIEFVGRADRQIKLRGFRIELPEIEAVLLSSPFVQEAAVIVRSDASGDKSVIAYYVQVDGQSSGHQTLRSYVKNKLPGYMVPSRFIALDAIPRTLNGKVDNRALAGLTPTEEDSRDEVVNPRTPVEKAVSEIWSAVLNVEKISVYDNFFDLGGHSLAATRVVSRINETFNINLPLIHIFEDPTVETLARWVDILLESSAQAINQPIKILSRTEPLPLSFAQHRLWFLAQFEGAGLAYHIAGGVRLLGHLDRQALSQALNHIVTRHEALRTSFSQVNGQPVQVIGSPEVGFFLNDSDLKHAIDKRADLQKLAEQEVKQPFDLDKGPLARGKLVSLGAEEHVLFVTLHHIIADGWSIRVFINELVELYEAFLAQEQPDLPILSVQYADYAAWQRQSLDSDAQKQSLSYWKKKLKDAAPLLQLPTDRPRQTSQNFTGDAVSIELEYALAEDLRKLSRRNDATLYVSLLAGWAMLMSRLSGQKDVVIGTPVANRTRTEVEPLIGIFVNTVALRLDLRGTPTVSELLQSVSKTSLEAQQHQNVQFEQVVEAVQPARSLSHAPIFQVMFAWLNESEETRKSPQLTVESFEMPRVTSIFDLTLSLEDTGREITGKLEYATSLFNRQTINSFLQHWRMLLKAMIEGADKPINELHFLASKEQHQLREQWSCGEIAPDVNKLCVHELFEQQVIKHPDATSISSHNQQLTYTELDTQSNRLAHYLQKLGVAADCRVATIMQRSPDMIIAFLATLKAGGACVPLDTSIPDERLSGILEDISPQVILTHSSVSVDINHLSNSIEVEPLIVELDSDKNRWGDLSDKPLTRSNTHLTADHLAYVVYTSGTTGKPKGVAMPHASLVNLINWQIKSWGSGNRQKCVHFAAIGFDVAFQEIFCTLCSGAQLDVIDDYLRRDFPRLLDYLSETGVERLFLPYVALQGLAEAADVSPDDRNLKLSEIITAGEQLHVTQEISSLFSTLNECKLHNHYGPAETHVTTTYTLPRETSGWTKLPSIGMPVANSSIYILDQQGQPVPKKVVGEIYIGGIQLARCYWNKPALTAERFLPDPFSTNPGARLYKTGDLARWQDDGNIDYLRRVDRQVKLRGFRIELQEIESVLIGHDQVVEAAVVVDGGSSEKPDGREKRLVAFATLKQTSALNDGIVEQQLSAFLREQLPDYMVPAAVICIERLPVTSNGKIDHVRLLELGSEVQRRQLENQPIVSLSATQELVINTWKQVLNISDIRLTDNFFTIGGNSLNATKMLYRLREVLQSEVSLKTVFQFPVVEDLAKELEAEYKGDYSPHMVKISKVSRDADLPLSFSQQRLWLEHQLQPSSAAYNMPAAISIQGQLNLPAFEKAINQLVTRHEILRTSYAIKNNHPVQVIGGVPKSSVEVEDLSALTEQDQQKRSQEIVTTEASLPFDLINGPIFRVKLLHMSDTEHVLLLNTHHIACDGWSIALLRREIGRLYQGAVEGTQPQLPELPYQYADYAHWQRELIRSDYAQNLLDYWKGVMQNPPGYLTLPTDKPRTAEIDFRGQYKFFPLSNELGEQLRQLSRQEGTTLFMTMLAAFNVLLGKVTAEEDILVGSAIAGRGPAETESLIGCFVNMLVLRTDLSGDPSFRELLSRVKEMSLNAYAHQDLPFDMLVDKLKPQRRPGYPPFFQIAFGLQNQQQLSSQNAGITLENYPLQYESVRYDLTVWIYEGNNTLEVKWAFRSDLFELETIEALHTKYVSLLTSAISDPTTRISQLETRSIEERESEESSQQQLSEARQQHFDRTKRKSIKIVEKEG